MNRSRSFPIVALAVGAALALGGCVLYSQDGSGKPGFQRLAGSSSSGTFDKAAEGKITNEELAGMVQGFADRYYALISSASDALLKDASSPEERLFIERLQSRTVLAVFDIASNPDPFSQLLDLTVVVTLTATLMIDEARLDEILGSVERAQVIKAPLRKAREEIWEIAARVMTPEQLETLDRLIFDWRKQNPDGESISFVRFDDFAASRGKSVIADVRGGTGLLAPIDDAKKEANEARLFAERVFYMAKRAPLLVSMETGHLLSQIAATPTVEKVVAASDSLASSASRLAAVAEALPTTIDDQRDHIVSAVDATSGSVRSTLVDYERAVSRTDDLLTNVQALASSTREVMASISGTAETLTTTLDAAERVAKQFAPAPGAEPSTPIDPEVYARIVADLRGALVEANAALEKTRTLAEGAVWEKPLAAAEKVAAGRLDQASGELRSLVDVIFVRSLVLIGAIFVLLFAFQTWSAHLRGRANRKAAA